MPGARSFRGQATGDSLRIPSAANTGTAAGKRKTYKNESGVVDIHFVLFT